MSSTLNHAIVYDPAAIRSDLEQWLRQWAGTDLARQSGVELLIRHGAFIYVGAPWIRSIDDTVLIDSDALQRESSAMSSGQRKIATVAASLLGGKPVDLAADVAGLDRAGLTLVLAAIAHAAGSHWDSRYELDAGGTSRIVYLSAIVPWPPLTNRAVGEVTTNRDEHGDARLRGRASNKTR